MNLLKKRKEKGYSQEKLASIIGVSRPFISQMETGECSPSIQTAQALAKALDCTIDELLAESEEETKKSAERGISEI